MNDSRRTGHKNMAEAGKTVGKSDRYLISQKYNNEQFYESIMLGGMLLKLGYTLADAIAIKDKLEGDSDE